jgi:hypothetical protein
MVGSVASPALTARAEQWFSTGRCCLVPTPPSAQYSVSFCARQGGGHIGDHRERLVFDLIAADPVGVHPRRLQRRVLATVAVEGAVACVEPEAVDLKRHPVRGPEEVDREAGDLHLRLRRGQPSFANQLEKALLGFGSRDRRAAPIEQLCEDRSSLPARCPRDRRSKLSWGHDL